METPVSATELARKLGDYLARIRYRRESFVVERNGKAVARMIPAGEVDGANLAAALSAWCGAAPRDPDFAKDLDRIAASDRPPEDPWAS